MFLIQEHLCELLCHKDLPNSILCDTLQLVLSIYENHGAFCPANQVGILWDKLMVIIDREVNARAASIAVTISAVILHKHLQQFWYVTNSYSVKI